MLEFLLLLTVFIRPVFSIFLFFTGLSANDGLLPLFYIAVAALDYGYVIVRLFRKKKFHGSFWVICIVVGVITILSAVTGLYYSGTIDGDFRSSLMSFVSLSGAAALLGSLAGAKEEKKQWFWSLPVFIVMLTALTASATIATLGSWDGLVHNNNDFDINYQNCSYYAAYALGLGLYYITSLKDHEGKLYYRLLSLLMILLLPLQLLAVMISGGRGGFLLAGVECLYFGIIFLKQHQKSAAVVVLSLGGMMIAIVTLGAWMVLNGSNIRGLSRILSFITNPGDSNRQELYGMAIETFLASPIIGNGIGSIWFTVGYYSHDIFLDLLSEIGLVGIIVVVVLLIAYLRREWIAVGKNQENRISLVFFIGAMVMLLFSGYYMTEPMLWLALPMAFSRHC